MIDSDKFNLLHFCDLRDKDLFAKTKPCAEYIADLMAKGFYQYRRPLLSPCKNRVIVFDKNLGKSREMIMMASNNYLGLTSHPKVVEAGMKAIEKYGSGGSSAPLLSGTFDITLRLEERIAKWKKCEEAMVFSTGYSTNVGIISALIRKHDVVIIDKLNHASIIDGCKLSDGDFRVFPHQDMKALEKILQKCDKEYDGKLIIVDGVFGMDGDICSLPQIKGLADRYGAKVMIDEAHATGVIGKHGRGTTEYFNMEGQIDLVMGTFSKALGGCGGFVAASHEVINYIRCYANSYFFSAALPPVVCATVLAAIEVIEREPQLIEKLHQNVIYMHDRLKALGFQVNPPITGILTIIVGEETKLRRVKRIHEAGLYANAIPFPAVPLNKTRIKLSLMATHTKTDLDEAVEILEKVGREFGII